MVDELEAFLRSRGADDVEFELRAPRKFYITAFDPECCVGSSRTRRLRHRGFDGQSVVAVCSAVTSFSRVRWLGGSGFDLEAFLLQNFRAGERRSAEIIKWTSRYVKGRWMD